jgi:eukaryotic-like serine/threonine-protein kinase
MDEREFSPGDQCDGYRIAGLIAAGGVGDVYEAVHVQTGRTVALKCLKHRHRGREDARQRMKMEAVVLSEIQHANLVQVYDAGVTDEGMVWIAMERLHGETLRDKLSDEGRISVADALYYASEVGEGVDAVHEANVIHRDLKPENVFVTARKVVKVIDLGTGKFTGYGMNSTDRMRVIGTTAYMSPEQIKGKRVDARADVYAIGLMLYEMLSGHHPLSGSDGHAGLPDDLDRMAMLQLQMVPEPLSAVAPDVPHYVSAIVEKATKKDRDQRQNNMMELVRELRAARKRFIAEQHLEDVGIDPDPVGRAAAAIGEQGAATVLRSPELAPGGTERCLMPDMTGDPSGGEVPTIRQMNVPEPTGLTPVPAQEATEEVSQAGLLGRAADCGRDPTERAIASDDVHVRTTHTNPALETGSSRITPQAAVRDGGSSVRTFSKLAPQRIWATLGLGALIGVPPAVVGVTWSLHRQRPPQEAMDQSLAAAVSVETVIAARTVDPAPAAVPAAVSEPEVVASAGAEPKPPEIAASAAPKRAAAAAKATKLDAPDWEALVAPSEAAGASNPAPAAAPKRPAKKRLPGSGL